MTNLVFNRPVMTLSDLRRLGRQGGAMLYLSDGRQAIIRPRYAVVKHRERHNGRLVITEEELRFHNIFSAISTVKRKHLIIAERVKRNGNNLLVLTGVGYHRPKQ